MLLQRVEFGSLFAYTPRPHNVDTEDSYNFMMKLKSNEIINFKFPSTCNFVANTLDSCMNLLPYSNFFDSKPLIVPIPKTTLIKSEYLWVPHILAVEIYAKGLGSRIVNCLNRVYPLPKSSTSKSENRPKAIQHYDSLSVQRLPYNPPSILLIDDVITRGATILGAASRLAEAYPNSSIKAFAGIRTISNSLEFQKFLDPQLGTIELRDNDTYDDHNLWFDNHI